MDTPGPRRPVLTMKDALTRYLKLNGLSSPAASDQISRAWLDILGLEIARRTRLARTMKKGVLLVEVDSPALLGELSGFRKAEILQGLRERVKRRYIEDIRFKLGTGF